MYHFDNSNFYYEISLFCKLDELLYLCAINSWLCQNGDFWLRILFLTKRLQRNSRNFVLRTVYRKLSKQLGRWIFVWRNFDKQCWDEFGDNDSLINNMVLKKVVVNVIILNFFVANIVGHGGLEYWKLATKNCWYVPFFCFFVFS